MPDCPAMNSALEIVGVRPRRILGAVALVVALLGGSFVAGARPAAADSSPVSSVVCPILQAERAQAQAAFAALIAQFPQIASILAAQRDAYLALIDSQLAAFGCGGQTPSLCTPAPTPPVGAIVAQPGVVTIGTPGNDVIYGTPGPDRIAGMGGDDLVLGLGGDDQLAGGDGSDTLCGGDGNDRLAGGAGNDVLSGEAGNDDLAGNAGDDQLIGGPGADNLSGNDGTDTCVAGTDTGDATNTCE